MALLDATLLEDQWSKQTELEQYNKNYQNVVRFTAKQTSQNMNYDETFRNQFRLNGTNQSFNMSALLDGTMSTSTSETFTPPANLNTSAKKTITLITRAVGFQIAPYQTRSNNVSYMSNLNQSIYKATNALAADFTSDTIAYLNSNKTQVWEVGANYTGGTFSFNTTDDKLNISKAAQQDMMFPHLTSMFDTNLIGANSYDILANNNIETMIKYTETYGANNSRNLASTLPNNVSMFSSNMVSNAASSNWDGYMCRAGETSVLYTLNQEFWEGYSPKPGYEFGFMTGQGALEGIPVGIIKVNEAADISAIDGIGRTHLSGVEMYCMVIKYAFTSNYNQDLATRPSGILKLTAANS